MLLTLIGYRATGKTTLARLLAERLGCDWIDADVEIERRAGKSIARFSPRTASRPSATSKPRVIADLCRRQEPVPAGVIGDPCRRQELVLAAGGGAPLRPESREAMRAGGKVVWLKATPATIHARMSGDQTTAARRPNLTNQGGLEEIVQVLTRREPIYRQTAHLEVDTEEKRPGEIVEEILSSGVVYRPCEANPPLSRLSLPPLASRFRPMVCYRPRVSQASAEAEGDSMSKTFEQGKEEVAKLCQYFATNRQAFLRPRRQGSPRSPDAHRPLLRVVWAGTCGMRRWPRPSTGKSFLKTALT